MMVYYQPLLFDTFHQAALDKGIPQHGLTQKLKSFLDREVRMLHVYISKW